MQQCHLGRACCVSAKPLQSFPTLCNPTDCSPPASPVHGILQARILEWVAMPFQGIFLTQGSNSSLLCLLHWQSGSLPLAPPGKPLNGKTLLKAVRNISFENVSAFGILGINSLYCSFSFSSYEWLITSTNTYFIPFLVYL